MLIGQVGGEETRDIDRFKCTYLGVDAAADSKKPVNL